MDKSQELKQWEADQKWAKFETYFLLSLLVVTLIACGVSYQPSTDTPVWTQSPTSTPVPTWTSRPEKLVRMYFVADSLNLREQPCEDDELCPPVFQMPAGTQVALEYERGDGWVLVRIAEIPVSYPALQVYVGVRGWCYSEWLEER